MENNFEYKTFVVWSLFEAFWARSEGRGGGGMPSQTARMPMGHPFPNGETPMGPSEKMQRMQKNLLHFRKRRTIFIICIKIDKNWSSRNGRNHNASFGVGQDEH
ncbi:MAG: hypothetical protein K6G44_14520 [Lentisphaeria bacterium]|nr:hypothetical protein [Lentisphaeria bacterium]